MKHHFENKNLLAVAAPDTKSGTAEYLLEVVVSLVSSAFSVARVLAALTSGRSVATSRSITAGWSSAARSIVTLVSRGVVAIRVVIFAVLHETDVITDLGISERPTNLSRANGGVVAIRRIVIASGTDFNMSVDNRLKQSFSGKHCSLC